LEGCFEVIPTEKHCGSKMEIFTVGYNNRVRHYLARFSRKTKMLFKEIMYTGIFYNFFS
jgi:insertion element IS1 protein InsB